VWFVSVRFSNRAKTPKKYRREDESLPQKRDKMIKERFKMMQKANITVNKE